MKKRIGLRIKRFDLVPAEISWAKITATTLTVEMKEGRTLQLPTVALTPVWDLPSKQRRNFRVTNNGKALEWPDLRYKLTLKQLLGAQ